MEILTGIQSELEKLKLRKILRYDAEGKSFLADYFLVATSDSIIQMEAARNNLIELMHKRKIYLHNPLEEWHGGWCLLDFGSIIIHIFLEEMRSFYDLEGLFEGAGFKITYSGN
jgi:ribosome-associated protein